MSWESVLDLAAAICMLGGSFMTLAAGVGVLRFPDLLSRMHAGTKPQVLGVLLGLAGYALRIRSGPVIWVIVLVGLFQMLTAPVSAHMVGRAGYRTGKVASDRLLVDELTIDLVEAQSTPAPPGPTEEPTETPPTARS